MKTILLLFLITLKIFSLDEIINESEEKIPLRTKPRLTSKIKFYLGANPKVQVLEIKNIKEKSDFYIWYKVKFKIGWVGGYYLEFKLKKLNCSEFQNFKNSREFEFSYIYKIKLFDNHSATLNGGELGSLIPFFYGKWYRKNNKILISLETNSTYSINCYAGCAENEANRNNQDKISQKEFWDICEKKCDKESLEKFGAINFYSKLKLEFSVKNQNLILKTLKSTNKKFVPEFKERIFCEHR